MGGPFFSCLSGLSLIDLTTFHAENFLQVYSVGIGLNRIRFDRNRRRAERELEEIATIQDFVFTVDEFTGLMESLENITQIVCPSRVCPAA